MTTLTLTSEAHKAALLHAVESALDAYQSTLSNYRFFVTTDYQAQERQTLRQRVAFLEAFEPALRSAPVGMSVFVEGLEVDTLIEALESTLELENPQPSVDAVLSPANLQRAIVQTQSAWGAVDVQRLSDALSEQMREALDENNPIDDLLNALR